MIRRAGSVAISRPGGLTSAGAAHARALVTPRTGAPAPSAAPMSPISRARTFERRFVGKTRSLYARGPTIRRLQPRADQRSLDGIDLTHAFFSPTPRALPTQLAERGIAVHCGPGALPAVPGTLAAGRPFRCRAAASAQAQASSRWRRSMPERAVNPRQVIVYAATPSGFVGRRQLDRPSGDRDPDNVAPAACWRRAPADPHRAYLGWRVASWHRSPSTAPRATVSDSRRLLCGRIAEGTALLIGALPPCSPATTCGHGCGSGLFGAAALAAAPASPRPPGHVCRALEAARENVPCLLCPRTRLADSSGPTVTAILSNPPCKACR